MRLTIYKKMMLGFSAIILVMIIASVYVLKELNGVSMVAKNTLTSNVQKVDIAKQLKNILDDESESAQKYWVTRDQNYLGLFREASLQFNNNLKRLSQLRPSDIDRTAIEELQQVHQSFVVSMQGEFTNEYQDNYSIIESAKWNRINTLHQSLDNLIALNQRSISDALSNMEITTSRSEKIALLWIGCSLLVAISAAFIITRTITRPISNLIRGTEQIASGKFEHVSISSNDEISLLAAAINAMSDKVKEANEYRTHMIHQISHEIRTPLQAMLSAHDILRDQGLGKLNNEQLSFLDDISRGITRLTDFSQQYLDLAKVESGKMAYHMEPSDLFPIIEPLVQEATLIARTKNISVEMSFRDTPKVMVDSEKISIVVSNLLTNAVKYAHSGGSVYLEVGSCPRGVEIRVQDSGIGILPEDIDKVFSKFYQSDNTSGTTISGNGVGLALVKAYTEGHGGKVYVESTGETGTTFIIELPAVIEEDKSNAKSI